MTIINFVDKKTVGINEDALTTSTSGELLINFGDLATSGNRADGIFAEANDVTVLNFADIETSGDGAAGIFVQGDNARIENYGSVHTTGGFFGDFEFFSEGIFAFGNGFYIANHGSVLVEGEVATGLVGVGADGIVINYGHVDSASVNSSVIAVFADRSQAINAGLLTIRGDGNAGTLRSAKI